MTMFELILLAPVDEVDTLSDALDALDALSVSVEDADAQGRLGALTHRGSVCH